MKKLVLLLIPLLSVLSTYGQNPKIEFKTALGSIVAELYPEKAPITCENFIKYIEQDKFDSAHFYRVVRMDNQPDNDVKIEVIQGGLGFDRLDSGFPPIQHETTATTGILHRDGVLSMARVEPGTASSEFFICIGDQHELDFGGQRNPDGQGFAAFGQIIAGMNAVRIIQNLEDDQQMLVETVPIDSIIHLE